MGEEVPDWKEIWGAKVKVPVDLPDDLLKDAITTVTDKLSSFDNFEANGDDLVKTIKEYMDEKWDPHWHVFIGRNFGSMVTHETKTFLYFYFNDKAVMMFKAG